MKYLIVGLGNIGPQYAFTRHNIGFIALDRLAKKESLTWEMKKLAYCTEWKHIGRTFYFIKHTTYMNLSGKAVAYYMQQLSIPKENIFIITDDIALPTGKLRIKPKGSAGGHNGLKDIEARLGTNVYNRLKIGVGDHFPRGGQADYVLSDFPEDDLILMIQKVDKLKDILKTLSREGIDKAMDSFNE